MEMDVLTDSAHPDPDQAGLHRVTFAEECVIKATNSPKGGNIGLDMQILALAMERAKGSAVALSFDSDQGGEASDDYGYIPVMTNLIGGHLQFLLSPDGKMLRNVGVNEWLARAIGEAPTRAAAPKVVMNRPPPSPPPNDGAAPTNGLSRLIRQVSQIGAGGNAGAPSPKARSPVANTLRNLFTPEHFRQMLEFHFIPAAPVRVREEWKAQGDTP